MKVLAFPRTTMSRQCMEGHEINKLEPGTFMNRKGEWGQNLPPNLTAQDPDEVPQQAKTRRGGKRKENAPKSPLKDKSDNAHIEAIPAERAMKKPRMSLELSREQKSKNPDENPEYQGADFELGNQCQINVPLLPGECNLGARLDPPGSPQAIGSRPPKLAELQLLESRARDLGDRG